MKGTRLLGLLGLAVWPCLTLSCAAPLSAPGGGPRAAKVEPTSRTLVCAEVRMSARGHVCIRPLSAEEQQHRWFSAKLELQNDLPMRYVRLNGRGGLEPDDEGCVEYRYRYEDGLVAESVGYRPDGTVCDRSLFSQRATRLAFVDAWGRPDYSRERLHTGYILGHDQNGMVVRQQPLASDGTQATIQLAADLRYERDASRLEKRVCYFDAQGKAIRNASGVHCWSYERDEFGSDRVLQAWDDLGKPTTGADGAHRTVKEFDRYGNLLRRSSFGLDGKPVSTAHTHCPVIAYHRDAHGFLTGSDCLDGAGKPARFDEGHSSWRTTADARGRPREYRYFDAQGNLFTTDSGFARLELERDGFDRVLERRYFLADGKPAQEEGAAMVRLQWNDQHLEVKRSNFDLEGNPWRYKGCVSADLEYDQFRQLASHTCRGFKGEPALSFENVATTVSRYDAEGMLAEIQYLDTDGRPVNSRRGYARKLYSHDAQGVDGKSRHFKADGSELVLPRFAVLWVRPPHAGGFWPAPSRAHSVALAEEAHRELLAGMPWQTALYRYGDEKVYPGAPGDSGYLSFETIFPTLRAALEPLAVGKYSPVVEVPYGLAVYLRSE